MVFDDEIEVCEKCEHRLVRVKSYLKRNGACSWKTEYGCGIIDLKPIRKRIVPPGTDPKKVCPAFSHDPDDIACY